MRIDEFLKAIRKRGDSRLDKGLSSDEEALWKARMGRPLPRKHLELLHGANGIHIDADADTPQGMFEIHGIQGILESMEVLAYAELPPGWIVVGRDADSQTYAILDASTGEYFTVDAISPTEPLEEWDRLEDFLDWAARGPDDEEGEEAVDAQDSVYRRGALYAHLHDGAVRSIALVRAMTSRAVSAGDDGRIALWDIGTGSVLRELRGHERQIWSVSVAPDDRTCVSASNDDTIRVWDLSDGREVAKLVGHQGDSTAVHCHRHDRVLSCGVDRTVRSWNLESGKQVWCGKGHKREVTAVSCLGSLALSGSLDKTISKWNVVDGSHVSKVNAHRGWVYGVNLISKDMAASCGADGLVKVWSLPALEEEHAFRGHRGDVTAVTSCAGRYLVSGGIDGTVRVWDLRSRTQLACLRGHGGYTVRGIAVTDDMKTILSGGEDGRVIVWRPSLAAG